MSAFETSDEDCLAATKRDPRAFAPVYERHAVAVLTYLRRRTGSMELAAELTAEVFAAAIQAAPRFKPGESPVRAWLIGIANHKLVDSQRRARVADDALRRFGVQLRISDDAVADAEERLGNQADGSLAMALLADLPASQRDAVMARVVDERDYADLAEAFGTTEGNVRARVNRGLRRLGLLMGRAHA